MFQKLIGPRIPRTHSPKQGFLSNLVTTMIGGYIAVYRDSIGVIGVYRGYIRIVNGKEYGDHYLGFRCEVHFTNNGETSGQEHAE